MGEGTVWEVICSHREKCGGIVSHSALVPIDNLEEVRGLHGVTCSGQMGFEEIDCPHPDGSRWGLICCKGHKCLLCGQNFHSSECHVRKAREE